MFSAITNVGQVLEEFRRAASDFPVAVATAVANNAKMVLRESIKQIDDLVYSVPEGEYHRTKNLRRANKIEKVSELAWLVYNDAEYAEYVHDGTSRAEPKPWMGNAIDLLAPDMEDNLVEAGTSAFTGQRLGTGEQDAGDSQDSTQDEGTDEPTEG
jgi:hypothetical protein